MKKLRLAIEALRVESFDTRADATGNDGTVFAAGYTYPGPGETCWRYYTCPECATPWPECDSLYIPCEIETADLAVCGGLDTAEAC
jgi:hypothetical protein